MAFCAKIVNVNSVVRNNVEISLPIFIFFVFKLKTNIILQRGLEIAELKEEDMPMV